MSEIRQVPLSALSAGDQWLDLQNENASVFLHHVRSDNQAFIRLRDALASAGDTSERLSEAR